MEKLDSVVDKYGKVEVELRERMREMMDVRQAIEIIGQRQENLEIVQRNLNKLQKGNFCLFTRADKEGPKWLETSLRDRQGEENFVIKYSTGHFILWVN